MQGSRAGSIHLQLALLAKSPSDPTIVTRSSYGGKLALPPGAGVVGAPDTIPAGSTQVPA